MFFPHILKCTQKTCILHKLIYLLCIRRRRRRRRNHIHDIFTASFDVIVLKSVFTRLWNETFTNHITDTEEAGGLKSVNTLTEVRGQVTRDYRKWGCVCVCVCAGWWISVCVCLYTWLDRCPVTSTFTLKLSDPHLSSFSSCFPVHASWLCPTAERLNLDVSLFFVKHNM